MKLIGFTFNGAEYYIGRSAEGWIISDQENSRKEDAPVLIVSQIHGLSSAVSKFIDFKKRYHAHTRNEEGVHLPG